MFGHIEPSISLVFDGLLATNRSNFLFIAPELDDAILPFFISRCDAIIFVRHLLDPRFRTSDCNLLINAGPNLLLY